MAVLAQSKPTGASQLRWTAVASEASIELYWLPLGAGGWFVRFNGRIYEAIHELLECRRLLDLYHSALRVQRVGAPRGQFPASRASAMVVATRGWAR